MPFAPSGFLLLVVRPTAPFVASLLLVAMLFLLLVVQPTAPFVASLLLVAMPFAPSGFLLLAANSPVRSILAPNSDALCT